MKKLFTVMLLGLTFLLVFSTNVSASENENINKLKEEYESNILNLINSTDGDEHEEAVKQYNEYKALSENDQNKLVKHLNNPELMEQVMNEYMKSGDSKPSQNITPEEINSNGITVTKINEDIVIEEHTSDKASFDQPLLKESTNYAVLASESREANYTKNVKMFGITLMQYKSTLNYKRTGYGGKITDILGSDHRTTRNFTLNTTSYSGKIEDYASTYAYSKANLAIAFVLKGTWTYVDGECKISVDNYGNVTGYIK